MTKGLFIRSPEAHIAPVLSTKYFSDADIFPMISGTHAGVRNTGVTNAGFNSGTRLSVITVDRVNLYERSSANMSGRLTVYGIAHA